MNRPTFAEQLQKYSVILGEGALIERLRRDSPFELDEQVVNSAFIYEPEKRAAMAAIYRQYLSIAREHRLPMLLSTPTWRASEERIKRAGLAGRDLNGDNYTFIDQLRREQGEYAEQVIICGLLSCKGNAYCPAEALSRTESRRFHRWQAEQLAATGCDFIMAATLPALSEATGLAEALAATGKPYIVSFVLRRSGTLLDGTPLKQAISAIDAAVSPAPLAYMANCTHGKIFRAALQHPLNSDEQTRRRIIGLLANTANLEPEELDEREELVCEDPEVFGRELAGLHRDYGTRILGGCCGTDQRHISALASELTSREGEPG